MQLDSTDTAPPAHQTRISLTFRVVTTFQADDGTIVGQGEKYQSPNWPVELRGAHRLDADLDVPVTTPAK